MAIKHNKKRIKRVWFIVLITLLVGISGIMLVGKNSKIISVETIRDDLQLREQVKELQTTVTKLQKSVDDMKEREIALTSWTEKLLQTNEELSDLLDKERENSKELIAQNWEVFNQNKELINLVKILK